MQNNLVIVESPAKAKTINKFLGQDYNVLASYGHVRDLPSKNGSVIPEQDFEMLYQISDSAKKHISKITNAAKNANVILLATDPDREGESIAWHIVEVLREKKALKNKPEIKRVVFNEITKKAVLNAVATPRNIDNHLVDSQQARRALDYLVGFTISPILWRKLPGSRSAGRVQSVALRLIANRDNEIEKFKADEYWSIEGYFTNSNKQQIKSLLFAINEDKLTKLAIKDKEAADELVLSIKKHFYSVGKVNKKPVSRHPAPPFITSTLQQEAARKLGFSTKKTMKIAQELYEGIMTKDGLLGLITYMRTDGVQLSQDALTATREFIKSKYGNNYIPDKPIIYKSKTMNAQEAHEAIRPTYPGKTAQDLSNYLSDDQYKLYDLIWKRTIACQMKSAKLEVTSIDIVSDNNEFTFRASGSVILFDGFRIIYREGKDDEKEEESNLLPLLKDGEKIDLTSIIPKQHFTEPPPRYTEASLVKKLEELGIGRPSTYATIISVIQDRNYVRLEKKRFFCEDRGRVVTAFLEHYFKHYVEYDFTALLENRLDLVSSGKLQRSTLLNEFWHNFKHNADSILEKSNQEIIDAINKDLEIFFFLDKEGKINRSCPECSKGILSVKPGKFGIFIACSAYPECRYTRPINTGTQQETEVNIDPNQILGQHPKSGKDILFKKGPYGYYVESNIDSKLKRVGLPKNISAENLDCATAIKLLDLPIILGNYPDNNLEIKVSIGRFGPYIFYNKKYISLPATDDILSIDLERAIEIINNSKKTQLDANIELGKHPKTGDIIKVMSGRYGSYLKYGKQNIPLAKSVNSNDITIDQAVLVIDNYKKKK